MNEHRPRDEGHQPPQAPLYAPPPWPPYPGHYGPPAGAPLYPPTMPPLSAPIPAPMPAPMPAGAPYFGPPMPARSHAWIWGLVGSIVLVGALVIGGGAWALMSGPQTYGDDASLDRMWDACERGDMGACDRLYDESPLFSDYEDFGFTCGGRTTGELSCTG